MADRIDNKYQGMIVINTLMRGGVVPEEVRKELAEKWMEVGYITCYDCLEGRSSLCSKPPIRSFLDGLAEYFGGYTAEHTFGCRGAQFAVMFFVRELADNSNDYCDTIVVDSNCHYTTRLTAEMCRLKTVEPENSGYPEFKLSAETFEEKILEVKKETGKLPGLVFVTHVDPYQGNVAPVKEVGEICEKYEVPYCVNGAYTCGVLPINMGDVKCDFLTMSGHKSMASLGPVGFVVSNEKWHKEIFTTPKSEKIARNKIPGIFGCSVGGLPVISSMLSFPHVKDRVANWDKELEKIRGFISAMEELPTVKQIGEKPHRHHLTQFETPIFYEISKSQRKKGFFLAKGMVERGIVGLHRGMTKKLKMSVYGLTEDEIRQVLDGFKAMVAMKEEG